MKGLVFAFKIVTAQIQTNRIYQPFVTNWNPLLSHNIKMNIPSLMRSGDDFLYLSFLAFTTV